jgi:opacity protein-like surface antigen
MRRVAAGALLALVAAGCGAAADGPIPDAKPAPPQSAALGWQEVYGKPGARLVFNVSSLAVTSDGWRADVSVENQSNVRFAVATGRTSIDSSFGLMIMPTGDHRELDRLNNAGELPAPRLAETIEPPLPGVLEPGKTWTGTLAAKGALPGGSWARVVFGAFVAMGRPPAGLQDRVIWITDHTHLLEKAGQPTSVVNSASSASAAKSPSPAAISR